MTQHFMLPEGIIAGDAAHLAAHAKIHALCYSKDRTLPLTVTSGMGGHTANHVSIASALGLSTSGLPHVAAHNLIHGTMNPGPRPLTQPGGATVLTPGTNTIQATIAAAAAGTTFWFPAGTYTLTSGVCVPKNNQVFAGELGAIIDGASTQAAAISNATATGVEIKNLVFQNFTLAGINFSAGNSGGSGWNVHHNEFTANRTGYSAGSNQTVHHNYFHDNTQYGVSGFLVDATTFEWNESSGDNTTNVSVADQGATKFAAWRNALIRNNYIHGSQPWGAGNPHGRAAGSGVWFDLSWTAWNGGTTENNLAEGNLVESCHQGGVEFEIHKYANTIRYNVVRNNHGYGIFISSATAEAYGNVVVTNNSTTGSRAIIMQEDLSRFTEAHNGVTGWELTNSTVHDNTVDMRTVVTGAVMVGLLLFNGAGNTYYSSKGNSFQGDAARVASLTGSYWWWLGTLQNFATWQGNGQDTTGSISL